LVRCCVIAEELEARDRDALQAEPQHDALVVAARLKDCSRASLEAVLLASIVSQKMGVEDLRPNF
jgi:hypothetical protein